jgi:hypothetical protein
MRCVCVHSAALTSGRSPLEADSRRGPSLRSGCGANPKQIPRPGRGLGMTDRKAGVPQGKCGGEVPRLRFVARDDHPGRMVDSQGFMPRLLPAGEAPWKPILGEVPRLRFVARDDHPGRMVDLPGKRAEEARGRSGATAEEESEAECEARGLPKNIDFLNGESSSCW